VRRYMARCYGPFSGDGLEAATRTVTTEHEVVLSAQLRGSIA
jgi:hypothetical protein